MKSLLFYFFFLSLFSTLKGFSQERLKKEAFGILNACQNYYQNENSDILAKIMASDRNIISGIMDSYGACAKELGKIKTDDNFSQLISTFDHIDSSLEGRQMLNFVSSDYQEKVLQALFTAQLEYNGEIDKKRITDTHKEDFSHIDRDIVQKAIDKIKTPPTIPWHERVDHIASALNGIKSELNQSCQKFYKEYVKYRGKKCERLTGNGFSCNKYSNEVEKLWTDQQVQMEALLHPFKKDRSSRKLLATDHFRKKLFPLKNFAKGCALGKRTHLYNKEIYAIDVEKGNKQFQDLMYTELSIINSWEQAIIEKNDGDISKKVKNILKYRPYLLGNYLLGTTRTTQDIENAAKYICQNSLEIYQSDENWNKIEIAAGAAIVGSYFIPLIGPAISSSFTAIGIGVGLEGHLAISRLLDALNTQEGAIAGMAQEKIGEKRFKDEQERANSQLLWSGVDGILALIGIGSVRTAAKATPRYIPKKATMAQKSSSNGVLYSNEMNNGAKKIIGAPQVNPPINTIAPIHRKNIIKGAKVSRVNKKGKLVNAYIVKVDGEKVYISSKRGADVAEDVIAKNETYWPLKIREKNMRPRLRTTTGGEDISLPIDPAKKAKLDEAYYKLKALYSSEGEGENFIKINNQFIAEVRKEMSKQGILTKIFSSPKGSHSLVITEVKKDGNRIARLHLKLSELQGSRKITFSNMDNLERNSGAFNLSNSTRTELGPNTIFDVLDKNILEASPSHELTHQFFNRKRMINENTIFSHSFVSFHAPNMPSALKKDLKPVLSELVHPEEVYNYTRDLWRHSKQLKTLPKFPKSDRGYMKKWITIRMNSCLINLQHEALKTKKFVERFLTKVNIAGVTNINDVNAIILKNLGGDEMIFYPSKKILAEIKSKNLLTLEGKKLLKQEVYDTLIKLRNTSNEVLYRTQNLYTPEIDLGIPGSPHWDSTTQQRFYEEIRKLQDMMKRRGREIPNS